MADQKTCTSCGEAKAESAFERVKIKRKNPPPGGPTHTFAVRGVCKVCKTAAKRKRAGEAPRADRDAVPKPEKCITCKRPPSGEVVFKWRTDLVGGGWKNECNACFNSRKYYAECRARERERDEAGFLARNAANARAWRERNPGSVAHQQHLGRSVPERKIKHVRTYAEQNGVPFHGDDAPVMMARLSEPCAYCALVPLDVLNGLDRVDRTAGLTAANTVACCPGCNNMKTGRSLDGFLGHARRIAEFRGLVPGAAQPVPVPSPAPERKRLVFAGTRELREAEKTKEDRLSPDERVELWARPCYLCGRGPAFGVDRVDSFGIYEAANVEPCCIDCNAMKSHHPLGDFLEHVGHLVSHTAQWTLRDFLGEPVQRSSGPVRALTDPPMVFPSAATASRMIGMSDHKKIAENAVSNGSSVAGVRWEEAAPEAYRAQRMEAGPARRELLRMRAAVAARRRG